MLSLQLPHSSQSRLQRKNITNSLSSLGAGNRAFSFRVSLLNSTWIIDNQSMDKREEKTLALIYTAFSELIVEKDYQEMTVQDILDRSSVSRSAFYSHFKKKEDVLKGASLRIFSHVFSSSLKKEKSHDFSACDRLDHHHILKHIICHLGEEKDLIKGIYSSNGRELFQNELERELKGIMTSLSLEKRIDDIPSTIIADQLTGSFMRLLSIWITGDCVESPDQIASWFFTINGIENLSH